MSLLVKVTVILYLSVSHLIFDFPQKNDIVNKTINLRAFSSKKDILIGRLTDPIVEVVYGLSKFSKVFLKHRKSVGGHTW